MVNQRKTIRFYYDSLNAKLKNIVLNPDQRFIHYFRNNKELKYNIDAIVIEILPEDNISKEYFLIPDIKSIYNFNNLKNKEIVIIQYPKGKLSYSYGKIKEIYKDKYEFSHLANTNDGSSGSPILLKNSIQVIGIHRGGDINKTENYGVFIGPIFDYFKNFTIKKESWNKDIYNKKSVNTIENINEFDDYISTTNNNKIGGNININSLNNIENTQLKQMAIIYNIDKKENSIKIFGEYFVKNNKNNCYLIINGKQRELCNYLSMDEIKIENNQLKIKLIENKNITNISHMFSACNSLVSVVH